MIPYFLTLTNPVTMVYNEYTIEPDGELSYDPDELDNFNYFWRYTWTKFWNSKLGKYIAVRLFFAATALAILCPAFLPTYISAVVGIGVSLGGRCNHSGNPKPKARERVLERICKPPERELVAGSGDRDGGCADYVRNQSGGAGNEESGSALFCCGNAGGVPECGRRRNS